MDRWKPEIGSRVRVFFCKGNPNNALWHVRAHVDDGIVMRKWSATKQRWRYDYFGAGWWDIFVTHGVGVVEPLKGGE